MSDCTHAPRHDTTTADGLAACCAADAWALTGGLQGPLLPEQLAADPEPSPDDWEAISALLPEVGEEPTETELERWDDAREAAIAAYREEWARLRREAGIPDRPYRCRGCSEVRDLDDTDAPCATCELCASCSPTAGGPGSSQRCAVCDADGRTTVLAHVTSQQPGFRRWTEGTLSVAEDSRVEWRVVGRSIVDGETDRTRIELAADLPGLRKQARQAKDLLDDAIDRIREGVALCQCGEATEVRCAYDGRGDGWRVIIWMPVYLRASHEAAGNRGVWPYNGALLLSVSPDCADALVETDGEWTEVLPS